MSISYYGEGGVVHRPTPRTVVGLMLLNVAFAVLVLFFWTMVSFVLVEPLEWATWMPIGRGFELEDAVRYPFVVLWLWPLLGVAGSWFSMKASRWSLAYACAATPIVILIMVFGWYYLTPADWR